MTRLSVIEPELKVGRSLAALAAARQYLEAYPLDAPAELDRLPLFYPPLPEAGVGPHGQHFLESAFRRYSVGALTAYELAGVHLLGTDGIVVLESGVVRDSLIGVAGWQPDSNVAELRGQEVVRLRHPMAVAQVRETGRYAIGFNGAWRNHGHWLLQNLPKLHAFTMLRHRIPELKLVLPPPPPASAVGRTLELLGIAPNEIETVAPDQATYLASAILLPGLDLWSVSNFAIAAADAILLRLPTAAAEGTPRPDKIYIHRSAPTRSVANFEAIRPLLAHYGFAVVGFETMDFAEQIATMQAARYVIAEHGAATTNILFCRGTARVLQLFSPFCVEPTFWSVASRRGLDYGYLIGSHHPGRGHSEPSWNSDYIVAPERLEDAIRTTLRLPPRPASTPSSSAAPSPATAAAAQPAAKRLGQPAPAAARDTPTEGFGGIVEPIFEVINNPANLGRAGTNERLSLFASAVPPAQRPMLHEQRMPPELVKEHYLYPAPQTVAAYAVGEGVLWGAGFITLGRQFVAPPDCVPGYFRPGFSAEQAKTMPPVFAGAIGRPDVRTIAVDRAVAVATHPNLTYGHFLLEALPRLWLLAVLHEYGARIPLAMSRGVPEWAKAFARMLHSDQDIVWYDGATERLQAPSIVLPSMLHTEFNFHPAMNLVVRDLVRTLPPPDPRIPKLLYLASANFGDDRLENATEVEQAMRGLGFAVVKLADFSPEQQIRLFASASVVVAEHGEALYGALFAPPETRVVAINFANHYQSAIARLRGHRIAYVPPADGKFRHWRLTPGLSRTWNVDVDLLVRTVHEMIQSVA